MTTRRILCCALATIGLYALTFWLQGVVPVGRETTRGEEFLALGSMASGISATLMLVITAIGVANRKTP